MVHRAFRLYWLREIGCDAGTPISAGELPPSIRDRVLALAEGDDRGIAVRLPFLDRRECRRQDEILGALPFEREGNVIRAILTPAAAARDLAATLALTDLVWANTPTERNPAYVGVWQRVSMALQRWMREAVAEEYFRDLSRCEDREATYPMIVYQASRLYRGRSRTEFTYDLRDFPECQATVAAAWNLIGHPMEAGLTRIEMQLREAGRADIAHRYAPIWHHDIVNAVRKKPKRFAGLLAAESAIINAVIDLGTQRSAQSANRFSRIANLNLRGLHGLDMRALGVGVLEEATRALTQTDAGSRQNLVDRRMLDHRNVRTARRPELRIAA